MVRSFTTQGDNVFVQYRVKSGRFNAAGTVDDYMRGDRAPAPSFPPLFEEHPIIAIIIIITNLLNALGCAGGILLTFDQEKLSQAYWYSLPDPRPWISC